MLVKSHSPSLCGCCIFSLPSAVQQTARLSAGLLGVWAHCGLHPSVHLGSDMVSGPNRVVQNDHFSGAYCVGHRAMLFSSPLSLSDTNILTDVDLSHEGRTHLHMTFHLKAQSCSLPH